MRKPGRGRRGAGSGGAVARARATGAALADEVLRARDAALARRRRRVSPRRAAAARASAVAPSASRIAAAGAGVRAGVVVAEGDSWFDFPWHDVLRMLEDDHGYDVESVSHRGDRVEDMAYAGGQLEELCRVLERLLRRGEAPRAILLSAGGNDLAGSEFAMLLEHARSPRPGLNEDVVCGILEQRVRNAYVTLIESVTRVARARTGAVIPIVVHGYARPVPDGRGFLGGWGPLPGPWLQPGFRQKGYDDLAVATRIVGDLIDRFDTTLRAVAALPGFGHVRCLDLRSELSNGADYKRWWSDELHPTERGFRAVAARFAAAIEAG